MSLKSNEILVSLIYVIGGRKKDTWLDCYKVMKKTEEKMKRKVDDFSYADTLHEMDFFYHNLNKKEAKEYKDKIGGIMKKCKMKYTLEVLK